MISITQQTLKQKISFHGFGIHTAGFCEITLTPLDENQGIVFYCDGATSKYLPENVSGDERGSNVLFADGKKVMTIEHLVSALAGLGIDNVLIDVEGPEIPIKNGSPEFFVEQIKKAGIVKQSAEKKFFKIKEKEYLLDGQKAILALPSETFKVNFVVDFNDEVVKTDVFSFDLNSQDYELELSQARTFGFEEEIKYLLEKGLAQGATPDNALVINKEGFSRELNYPNEIVRHKVVDFIGDIMVLGSLPLAEFFVVKSGHAFNQKFARQIWTKYNK